MPYEGLSVVMAATVAIEKSRLNLGKCCSEARSAPHLVPHLEVDSMQVSRLRRSVALRLADRGHRDARVHEEAHNAVEQWDSGRLRRVLQVELRGNVPPRQRLSSEPRFGDKDALGVAQLVETQILPNQFVDPAPPLWGWLAHDLCSGKNNHLQNTMQGAGGATGGGLRQKNGMLSRCPLLGANETHTSCSRDIRGGSASRSAIT